MLQIHDLEIVTKDADAVCADYASAHTVKSPIPRWSFRGSGRSPSTFIVESTTVSGSGERVRCHR